MNSTRALLVTPYYDPNILGGAEISTQLIAEGIGDGVDVMTAGIADGERVHNGVRVIEVRVPMLDGVWAKSLTDESLGLRDKLGFHMMPHVPIPALVKRYRRLIEGNGYATVLVNSNEDAMGRASVWKAAHDSGARVVLALRDPLLLERPPLHGLTWNWAYRSLVNSQLKWIDAFVAPSRYMLDLYERHGMVKADSRVIPNAVLSTCMPDIPVSEKTGILYVGTLNVNKGVRTLLAALNRMPSDAEATFVGRGPLLGECEANPHATCLGWMPHEDVIAQMAKSRVVVLPSEWPEAFGRTLIEAVEAGTLVVGSDAGAIPEVLNHDERYLFSAGNAAGLAEKLTRLIELKAEAYDEEIAHLREVFKLYSADNYVNAWRVALDCHQQAIQSER